MDPATLALNAATALTAALALLFSRLDARRRRLTEPIDLRVALLRLSESIAVWMHEAANTNNVVQQWVQGQLDDHLAETLIAAPLAQQMDASALVLSLLLGHELRPYKGERENAGSEGWRSLRHLLSVYGPEVLETLETAFSQRRTVLHDLASEVPNLRTAGVEAMQEVANRLKLTSEELDSAWRKLGEYIRMHFPP